MKFRAAVLLCFAAVSVLSCVDLSPVRYVEMDAGGNNVPDSGDDDDSGAADASMGFDGEACDMCRATMCGAAVEMCAANEKCNAYAVCMTERNCWREHIVDFSNPPACLSECGAIAGITSQVDPAVGVFVGVLICAQNQCAPACVPGPAMQ